MTAASKDKLEQVLDLMSHANPKRSLATAFDRALDVLLRDWRSNDLARRRDVVARATGGSGDVDNARVLCRPHNLYEAERTFGQAHVARKIQERRGDAQRCGGGDVGASGAVKAVSDGSAASVVVGDTVATDGACGESGNHRRQERCGDAVRAMASETARDGSTALGITCSDGTVATEGACGRSGNHRRQQRCDGDGTDVACARSVGTTTSEAAHAACAAEVRGKLFAALTHMGFRRGETRDALARLAQSPEAKHAPFDELLRAALGLLTPLRN